MKKDLPGPVAASEPRKRLPQQKAIQGDAVDEVGQPRRWESPELAHRARILQGGVNRRRSVVSIEILVLITTPAFGTIICGEELISGGKTMANLLLVKRRTSSLTS